ncbi:MAG: COX15/CtaA family protein [Myxococcota bacterium]
MVARVSAKLLIAMVFVMILLGGIVHGTGSSLACPDWPLCYGEAMPVMKGGILFEHSHRLLGAAIGFFMIVLSVGLHRIDQRTIRGGMVYGVGLTSVLAQLLVFGIAVSTASLGSLWLEAVLLVAFALSVGSLWTRGMRLSALGLLGLELVVVQGLLGGLTVVMRLPPMISTVHLTIAMSLLAGLCYLVIRLHPGAALGRSVASRKFLGFTVAAVFAQIVLGAFMRHTGSTLACGAEALTCQGEWLGANGAAHTALAHRWFAVVVTGLVIAATVPLLRAAKGRRPLVRTLAIVAHGLVVVQVLLGFLALVYYVPVSLATVHQGMGALLLVDLIALFVVAGPWGARFELGGRYAAPTKLSAFGSRLSASS